MNAGDLLTTMFAATGFVVALFVVIVALRFAALRQHIRKQDRQITELVAARQEAEAASEAKTTFLATMSHEIRTPMNALVGLQELLSFSRLDAEQRESVRLMRQSSKSLLRLIDDILDFSKIEAGKLEIGHELTSLREVISEVCATFSAVAREKDLKLRSQLGETLPHTVMTDALRLKQILGNLVSNAIKFTRFGEVKVSAAPAADGMIEFEVCDTGIGMSPATLASWGEPFHQANAGMARRYGGSGLGLAICKRLCRLMNGTMEVASEADVGTRIKVRLPLEVVRDPAKQFLPDMTQGLLVALPCKAPTVEQAAANRQLILVVDDHPTNRRLLVQQLGWLGYACEAAGDGRAALERYMQRMQEGSPYAAIVMDCQMPDMDGYALAREIRKIESRSGQSTVLIAFTADTTHSASEMCQSCGFDDLITKPTNLASLKLKLDRWMSQQRRAVAAPAATAARAQGGRLIDQQDVQDEFRQAHEEDLAMLREGERASDAALVTRAAHRIKGAARMIGAQPLDDAAGEVLQSARTEDWREIRAGIERINQATQLLYGEFGSGSQPIEQAS